jgi:hypothetical protein
VKFDPRYQEKEVSRKLGKILALVKTGTSM